MDIVHRSLRKGWEQGMKDALFLLGEFEKICDKTDDNRADFVLIRASKYIHDCIEFCDGKPSPLEDLSMRSYFAERINDLFREETKYRGEDAKPSP